MDDRLLEDLAKYISNPQELIYEIEQRAIRVEYSKGKIIHRSPHPYNYVLYIETGLVRLYFYNHLDEDVTWVFGEDKGWSVDFHSFEYNDESIFYMEALTPVSGFTLTREDVLALHKMFPDLNIYTRLLAEERFLHFRRRTLTLLKMSPEERVQDIFSNEPELLKRVPQKYIASYIGLKPESFSRIKKRLHLK